MDVTVRDSVFSTNHVTFGNEAIAVHSTGTAKFDLDVIDNTFTNLQGDAVSARVEGNGGIHDLNITGNTSTSSLNIGGGDFQVVMNGGSGVTFDINNNTVTHAGMLLSGDPIQIVGNAGAEGRILNNMLSGFGGDAIRLDMGGSSALSAGNITWTVLVSGNTISNGSSTADDGIGILSRDHNGTMNLTIQSNKISGVGDDGISLFTDEDSPQAHTPATNLRIVGNTINSPNMLGAEEIRIRVRDAAIVCTHIEGNTSAAGTIELDEGSGTSIQITQSSVAALDGANSNFTTVNSGDPLSFNGTCTNPTLPSNP